MGGRSDGRAGLAVAAGLLLGAVVLAKKRAPGSVAHAPGSRDQGVAVAGAPWFPESQLWALGSRLPQVPMRGMVAFEPAPLQVAMPPELVEYLRAVRSESSSMLEAIERLEATVVSEHMDVTSFDRRFGLPGSVVTLAPSSTGEVVEEIFRIEQPDERAEVITVTFDVVAAPTETDVTATPIAQARIWYGTGDHQTDVRIDVGRGTTITVPGSFIRVEGIIPSGAVAAVAKSNPAAVRIGAFASRMVRPSAHKNWLSQYSDSLTVGAPAQTFDIPRKAIAVQGWRDNTNNQVTLAMLDNTAGGALFSGVIPVGANFSEPMPVTAHTSRVRATNDNPAVGSALAVLIYEIAV